MCAACSAGLPRKEAPAVNDKEMQLILQFDVIDIHADDDLRL